MTKPQSEPVIPSQPKQDSYGFSELALFKTFTRETYRAAFGVEAAPYDPARLTKTWFDSTVDTSDPNNVVLYKAIYPDQKGQWGVRQVVLPTSEAAMLNLPGAVMYPPYVIAPTAAARGGNSGIWPVTLSLRSEAEAMLEELGLSESKLFDEGEGSVFPVVYGEDPRRQWVFGYRGVNYGIGGLLASKNAHGVGAPGHWSVAETIEWIPDAPAPTGLLDARPPREMPVRDLLATERITMTLMGPVIVRSDRQQVLAEASGQFTNGDRQVLREVQRLVQGLVQQLAPKA